MGGKVFDDLGLRVPRMPPDVYQRMISEIQPKLKDIFDNVVVPRDAPSKTDYGDIDFLVGGLPDQPREAELWKLVEGTLGAVHRENRGQSQSYAIPHPNIDEAHVQVDIELNPGEGTSDAATIFAWTNFMKSDGDLLQIIGIAHRPLGLTCTDKGLHVRLEQIEPYDKKEARLLLTRDPDQAMRFYGLDVDKYKQGFNSEIELFDWVAAGRFFSRDVFERRIEKADDRTRLAKRPMYRRFIAEYMPRIAHGICKDWSRDDLLRDALEAFDVQSQYDEKMDKHNSEEAEKLLWEEVKATIPAKNKSLKSALRALRRWVVFKDGRPAMLGGNQPNVVYFKWAEHVDQSNKSEVLTWVERNWQHVKTHDKAQGIDRA